MKVRITASVLALLAGAVLSAGCGGRPAAMTDQQMRAEMKGRQPTADEMARANAKLAQERAQTPNAAPPAPAAGP